MSLPEDVTTPSLAQLPDLATEAPPPQPQRDVACVFGASGACGRHLVEELLHRPEIGEVYCFLRGSKAERWGANPKYREVLLTNDLNDDLTQHFPPNCDVVFSGLAVHLKQAGSQEAKRLVDFDMNNTIATFAQEQGVPQYYLISTYGADSSSRFFYLKMKGELEDRIKALRFPRSVMIQPGFLCGAEREDPGIVEVCLS